ncbi:MAG: hypothetical protein ABIW79_11030 [Gemmatimonas sp.]
MSRAAGADHLPPVATRLERDYAQQIVVNAEIAVAKYRVFTGALWFLGAAAVLAIIGNVRHLLS